MTAKEINDLRKSGKLEEAYAGAIETLKGNPESKYIQSALFWACRDLAQKMIRSRRTEEAKKLVGRMGELCRSLEDDKGFMAAAYSKLSIELALPAGSDLPDPIHLVLKQIDGAEGEIGTEIADRYAWIIYNYLKAYIDKIPEEQLRTVLKHYFGLPNTRPSLVHSLILRVCMESEAMARLPHFRPYSFFVYWGGVEMLAPDDFRPYKPQPGSTFPSLALIVERKIFKELDRGGRTMERITLLRTFIDRLVPEERADIWVQRQLGRIAYWTGETEEAVECYKRVIRKQGSQYFIWSELGNILRESDPDLYLGCLFKAVSLQRDEQFIGPVRLDIAEELIRRDMPERALYQLSRFAKSHEHPTARLQSLVKMIPDPDKIQEDAHTDFAGEYVRRAEELICGKSEQAVFTLVRRWTRKSDGKHFAQLCHADGLVARVPVRRFRMLENAPIGSLYDATYVMKEPAGQSQSAFAEVRSLKAKGEIDDRVAREFQGTLRVKYRKGNVGGKPDFAFVDGVYVSADLLAENRIDADCEVKGEAVNNEYAGFTKKGWTAITLSKIEEH